MISLSTLYLKTQGAVLRKSGDTIVVTENKKNIMEYPSAKVSKIVIMGNIQVTSFALSYFMREGKEVFFLSRSGKFRGMLSPECGGGAEIRLAQYEKIKNNSFTINIIRSIVAGKLLNASLVCKALAGTEKKAVLQDLMSIKQIADKAHLTDKIDVLRGFEGAGTKTYYSILSHFLNPPFQFNGRNRRPPKDPINVLLSLGYTLLESLIFSAMRINLLDPYIGFFHSDKRGAPALALDMMEEWRPLIDYWVVKAVNKGVITSEHFSKKNGKIFFSEDGVKNYFLLFEKNQEKEIFHKIYGEHTSVFRCMILQSKMLRECITDRRENYIPFKLKL